MFKSKYLIKNFSTVKDGKTSEYKKKKYDKNNLKSKRNSKNIY